MKTLVFAVAGYNLAETGRLLEIAKACKGKFKIIFISYGGQYEHFIEKAGFELKKMEPRLTKEDLDRLRIVLSGETLNTVGYLTEEQLLARVPNEMRLFGEVKPAAVLTGWCLSVTISTRAAVVPFVNGLHSTSIAEYYKAGLQTWPDRLDFAFLRWFFSKEKLDKWFNKRILHAKWVLKPYNRVGKKYGLKEFNHFIELIEGDHTFLADIPEWVNLPKIRANLHFIGPLPFKSDMEVPKEVSEMPREKPIVYFAMGSSGKPGIIAEIIEGFKDEPYRVIAPVKAHIKDMSIEIPSNVIVTGFLPAHKVNPMADISVIHGGQNTVMQACLSGTPIVGVGMHPEQQANLDACVRKGFAIRLNKYKITALAVLEAIDKLLHDEKAKEEVVKFQRQLEKWDGPGNAAQFLYETYGK
ncbi:MAG: nucleotide disphospho-sugar-binding domain-containing protein [Planctomycetota bacterium]|jgi:UDP:flavonoid glycosyltransferase YjiC (YdhE family)